MFYQFSVYHMTVLRVGVSRIKLSRNQQAKCSPVIVSEKMTLRICSSVILWLKWVCPCIQYLKLWTWNCVLINICNDNKANESYSAVSVRYNHFSLSLKLFSKKGILTCPTGHWNFINSHWMFVWGTFSVSTQTGSFTWEILSRDK